MTFASVNNVVFDGYDFTSSYIEYFSRTALDAAVERNFAGWKLQYGVNGGYRPRLIFSVDFDQFVVAIVTVTASSKRTFSMDVRFFVESALADCSTMQSAEEIGCIAVMSIDFQATGKRFFERNLDAGTMKIRDGFADMIFVAMDDHEKKAA